MNVFRNNTRLFLLAITAMISSQCFGQTITPQSGRQAQHLWERHAVEFNGADLATSDSVFLENAHQLHVMTLAVSLCLSGSAIPVHQWPMTDSDTVINIWSSRTSLSPGPCPILLPSILLPESIENCSWSIGHNGDFTSINSDEVFYLNIPEDSQSTLIGIRMSWNGMEFERHILFPIAPSFNCPDPDLPPWPSSNPMDPWWIGVFHDGQPITGQALIKVGSDGMFNQPLIICEGFDPGISTNFTEYGFGDMNWSVLWNCDENEATGFPSFTGLLDSLLSSGFDLVYVDFADGTNSIQSQSTLLKEVIRLCRDYRTEPWPSVLIGASMGGVVGRWALREMELAHESHCVRLFASIDSPFRGAWLPPALQHAIEFFAPLSYQADLLFEALNSVAASQLLIESPFHDPSARNQIESAQLAMGPLDWALCAAVSNGNPSVSPLLNPSVLYSAQESFLGWDLVDINLFTCPGDMDHPESSGQNIVIHDAQLLNTDWEWGEPLQFESVDFRNQSLPCYAGESGSYSTYLQLFHDALEYAGISADSYQSQSVYIPCFSAFDLSEEVNMDLNNMPFDYWSFEPVWNPSANHCDISNHLEALWNWIVMGIPLQDSSYAASTSIFQMGWTDPFRISLGTLEVPENGALEIGTASANGPGVWPLFRCATTPCDPEISLRENAFLMIGDSAGIGRTEFKLKEGALLTLNQGSEIHIGPYSTLIMHENSVIDLNGAAIHIHPHGQLIQHQDAKIEVSGTSHIWIHGETSNWRSSGDLIVSEGDTLLIENASNLGGGQWTWFNNTAYSYLGQHAFLGFNSQGDGIAVINTENGSAHLFEGAGTVKFSKTSFNLADSSRVVFETKFNASHSEIIGFGVSDTMEFLNRCKWTDGHWENIFISFQNGGVAGDFLLGNTIHQSTIQAQGTGIHFENNVFTNTELTVVNSDVNSIIRSCYFLGGQHERPQVSILQNEENMRLEFNVFSHHDLGIRVEESTVSAKCNEWNELNIGCLIGNAAVFDCSHPYGGNRWSENGIHVTCNNCFAPLFDQGGNAMGHSNDATFLGTIQLQHDTAASIIGISQNGNLWPNSELGLACQVPYTALESTFGSEILFLDAASSLQDCDGDNPVQHDDGVNRKTVSDSLPFQAWRIYPNPAHSLVTISMDSNKHGIPVTIKILDSGGRHVLTEELLTSNSGRLSLDVSALNSGWHILLIEQEDHPTYRQPLLIFDP